MNNKTKSALLIYARYKAEREAAWLDQTLEDGCSGAMTIRLAEIIERVTFDCWAFFERMQQEGEIYMLMADRIAEPEQADIERGVAVPRKTAEPGESAMEDEQERSPAQEERERRWQQRKEAWLRARREQLAEPQYSPKRTQKPKSK